jgi:hypothetical protein
MRMRNLVEESIMKVQTGLSLAAALALCAGTAIAAINPIGEFTGDYFEGFETQTPYQFMPFYDVFDGTAVLRSVDGSSTMHITSSWGYYYTIYPHGGGFFFGSAGPPCEYVFDKPAALFGGFFGTNYQYPDGTADFYDEDGNLLASLSVSAPLGNWKWNGWEETTGVGIKSVVLTGAHPAGGWLMQDDMQYTPIPGPGALALIALGGLVSRRRR